MGSRISTPRPSMRRRRGAIARLAVAPHAGLSRAPGRVLLVWSMKDCRSLGQSRTLAVYRVISCYLVGEPGGSSYRVQMMEGILETADRPGR